MTGSGHFVYLKPTLTNLYLHTWNCSHPLKTLYTELTLSQLQLAYLKISTLQRNKTLRDKTKNQEAKNKDNTQTIFLSFLPFAGDLSFKIAKFLCNFQVKAVLVTPSKISDWLASEEGNLLIHKAGICQIPCWYGMTYRSEHMHCSKLANKEGGYCPKHCISTGHSMNYYETMVLLEQHFSGCSIIRESMELFMVKHVTTRDSGC